MVSHDQILKELVDGLAADFLTLTLPDIAAQVDLNSFGFRKGGDYFLDTPQGRRRSPDLTGWGRRLADPTETTLIHVEAESHFRKGRLPRFPEYNGLLSLRHHVVVHTVVVYLHGGPPGLTEQEYKVSSFDRQSWVFSYKSWGLSRSLATEYLKLPVPLAWGLAALMNPKGFSSRAELAIACLRRILKAAELDEACRYLLLNFVQTYVESDEETLPEYDDLLRKADGQEVQEMMMTWADRMKEEGREEVRGEVREVREEVREVRGEMQNLVLLLLGERFGRLSERIQRRVKAITSGAELGDLASRAAQASSLKELGLV
jgi:hypothetical protein